MSRSTAGSSTAGSSGAGAFEGRTFQTMAAWAGILGPILFTVCFLSQELARRGEFDPVAEPVSALEAGPNGWVQRVNFVVLGLLTLVHAVGLHRWFGWAGPALLGLSGIGNVLAAVFPLREDASGAVYDPGGHAVAGVVFFLSSAIALLLLARRMRLDARWRRLAGYTAVAGTIALVSFPVMGALVIPEDAVWHEWAGLAQRLLILLVIFPCRVALAERMRRVVAASPNQPATSPTP